MVADADTPGMRGARTLATALITYVSRVQVITPPEGIKDVRAWKQAGATHHAIQNAIDAAPECRLSIDVREVAKHGR